MKTIFITIVISLVFASILGFVWVCIHLFARYRLGERSGRACEITGDNPPEHCCQYIEQCPEEIRSKCKHAIKNRKKYNF